MINNTLVAAVLVLTAAPAFAQNPQAAPSNTFDSRWNPYLGCWRIVQEHMGDQNVPIAPGLMVCAQPSGRAAVAVTTTVDGKNVLEQTIIADGSAQPVTQADCRGTQTSDWSRDGERLFTRVEIECAGRPKRVISGITQLAKGHWLDAQATVIDGNHDVRLRRYQRTSDQYGSMAAAGAPMSVEDVIEASAKVLSPALEAALVEGGGRFSLNSRALKQLADAGVSPNVIDVMVAQAFPDRFEIERPSTYPSAQVISGGTMAGGAGSTTMVGAGGYASPMYDPFYNSYYYSPFAYPYYWGASYSPYRYNYGYGGYSNNYNNFYYGYPGGSVYYPNNPGPGRPAQPGSPDSPGGDGVVVNGRGYTRVRPSGSTPSSGESAQPTQRTPSSGRGARAVNSGSDTSSSGSSSSSSSTPSSSSSSSGSSSSGASSGGYLSGSNSGDGGGGRTAQPR
ncbi:MAG: hypothetical protein EXQ48_04950 [Acidobacteria bacterium]|nr:hypothetical protein [Acidobacteriota bacterium]